MVLTRSQARVAFFHLMDNVFESKELKSALVKEGYEDVISLLTIDEDTIESLTYVDTSEESKLWPIKRSDIGTLRAWKEYYIHQSKCGKPISDMDEWLSITQESFDAFRCNPLNIIHLITPRSRKVTSSMDKNSSSALKIEHTPDDEVHMEKIEHVPMADEVLILPTSEIINIDSKCVEEQVADGNVKVNDINLEPTINIKEELVTGTMFKEEKADEHCKEDTDVEPSSDVPDRITFSMVIHMLDIIYPLTQIAVVIAGLIIANWITVHLVSTPSLDIQLKSELPQPWLAPPWMMSIEKGECTYNGLQVIHAIKNKNNVLPCDKDVIEEEEKYDGPLEYDVNSCGNEKFGENEDILIIVGGINAPIITFGKTVDPIAALNESFSETVDPIVALNDLIGETADPIEAFKCTVDQTKAPMIPLKFDSCSHIDTLLLVMDVPDSIVFHQPEVEPPPPEPPPTEHPVALLDCNHWYTPLTFHSCFHCCYNNDFLSFIVLDPSWHDVLSDGETYGVIGDPIIKSLCKDINEVSHDIIAPLAIEKRMIYKRMGRFTEAKLLNLLKPMMKFLVSINNDQAEEIITYNKLLDYISLDEENDIVWKFRRIVSHQGPLKPEHPDYKGSNL